MTKGIEFKINRAPVLTLWAAIVAERLGFDHNEALTLGRAVAGLNAYSKGKRLGIFKPSEETLRDKRKEPPDRSFEVELLNRAVTVLATDQGIRALSKDKPISPSSVEKYLTGKFGDHLLDIERAMADLANSMSPERLTHEAFKLYERFRPTVPEGVEGWGAAGLLKLDAILGADFK